MPLSSSVPKINAFTKAVSTNLPQVIPQFFATSMPKQQSGPNFQNYKS